MLNAEVGEVSNVPDRVITDIAIDNLKIVSDISSKCDALAYKLLGIEASDKAADKAIAGLKETEETVNVQLMTINDKLAYILSRL